MTLSIARARRLLYSIPVILFLYYYFNKEKNTREEIQIDNFGASTAVLDDFSRAQLGSSWSKVDFSGIDDMRIVSGE